MWAAWMSIVATAGCTGCNDGIASLGERCDTVADCEGNLQCLDHICKPGCNSHAACGDGMLCEGRQCIAVESEIGDPCDAELDCGPGQTCRLAGTFSTSAGFCATETLAAPIGAPCTLEAGCRAGTCSLGRCTALCADSERSDQCVLGEVCAKIPRVKPDFSGGDGEFHGCLPGLGNLTFEIPIGRMTESTTVTIPVPTNAKSMVLVSEVLGSTQLIGATRVLDPGGAWIFERPETQEAYYENDFKEEECERKPFPDEDDGKLHCQHLRHTPLTGISVLAIPTTTMAPLKAGLYTVSIGTFFSDSTPSADAPRQLRVVEKLGNAGTSSGASLELHFYFLDLEDHPCGGPVEALRAATAPQSPEFQEYLAELEDIFHPTVTIPTPSFTDLTALPAFDGLAASRAGELFQQSTEARGISIYFVRSLSPAGLEIAVGGTPGSPLPGTRASGIAIAATALCYQSWKTLARLTAHAIARHVGLYRNVEPNPVSTNPVYSDPLASSPDLIDPEAAEANLMSWGEHGGTTLVEEQRNIIRNSPVVR